ncbi:MAG: RagB/SusD family nutrient uptake outer membrane protein [Paludibacter sp.]
MKKHIIITLCCLGLFCSCEDFLTEKPKSVLTPENAYTTARDWQQGLTGAYAMLQNLYIGKYTITLTEFGTDEVEPYDVGWAAYAELKLYTFSASHPFFSDHYTICYEGIKRSNAVIDMPDGVVDDATKQSMIYQARFLRAIYYFDLVRMYGGVPLWTQSSIDRNEIMKPRATVDQVYEQITQDLKAAESLPTTWSIETDKGRATSYAAQAILARVYLQWGKPSESLTYINKVIGKFKLYDNYNDIFDPKNKNKEYENIFEVQSKHSGAWGLEGSIQSNYWGPRGVGGPTNFGGWGGFGPTQYIYNSFDNTDKRKAAFFATSFNGVVQSPPCNRKFVDPVYGNVIEDDDLNFTIIRYADVLLMKAEVLNDISASGKDALGQDKYDCINAVRKRANLPDITASQNITNDQFSEIVLNERLHELCFEHMRRWDLIRFGKLQSYLQDHVGITIQSFNELYPIPQSAIDANDKITTNNPGY